MVHTEQTTAQTEVHDPQILAQTRALLDACQSPREMQEAVLAAVARNEEWRGKRCLNLLAPEAPTSPTVRALLSAEPHARRLHLLFAVPQPGRMLLPPRRGEGWGEGRKQSADSASETSHLPDPHLPPRWRGEDIGYV